MESCNVGPSKRHQARNFQCLLRVVLYTEAKCPYLEYRMWYVAVGDVVSWPAFSSVTTSREVAVKFAKEQGVVFEICGITADSSSASISVISVYPN